MSSSSWQEKAAAKRADTMARIKPEWRLSPEDVERAGKQRDITGSFIEQFLEKDEINVTNMDSVPLVNNLKEGTLSATQVTTAFCKRAAIAHQINNCLHEIFFDQALERAKSLDAHLATHKTPLGPLHGLPISLKDQFHVKGVDTTMGYVGWIGKQLGVRDPSQTHRVASQLVTDLLGLGAVVYCKTSVPQTLLFGETTNNLIGRTMNPRNGNLSCGGSSGGEGALLALRASSLGVGTDIGGSVRIPAAFNGVWAVKPTPERVSYRGVANTIPGETTYRSTVGFMSTSLEGLVLALRAVLGTEPWLRDPAVVPIPFRGDVYDQYAGRAKDDGLAENGTKPLKLGVLWTDGDVNPHPPVNRGLRMVVDAVRNAGHGVVDWNPPRHAEAVDIHFSFLSADGGHDINENLKLSGEPLIPDLAEQFKLKPPVDVLDYHDKTLKGLEYEARYSDYWNSTAEGEDGQIVDAVIMPVAPHAAVVPGKYYHVAYTETINLRNYSAVVLPVTFADKSIDGLDEAYKPLNEKDEMNWKAYDPDIYDGGPVGVQIVGRKFEEEKVLAIAGVVGKALERARSG